MLRMSSCVQAGQHSGSLNALLRKTQCNRGIFQSRQSSISLKVLLSVHWIPAGVKYVHWRTVHFSFAFPCTVPQLSICALRTVDWTYCRRLTMNTTGLTSWNRSGCNVLAQEVPPTPSPPPLIKPLFFEEHVRRRRSHLIFWPVRRFKLPVEIVRE